MEWFMIEKENGGCVPCIAEVPESPAGIVIVVHGFTSCKESMTGKVLMQHLPPAGLGVVAYDHPGHGTDAARFEDLRVSNCLDSLAAVEETVCQRWPDLPVYYFGSSFGAYITALYTAVRPHNGARAVFRSAAVNMPAILLGDDLSGPDAAVQEELDRTGYVEPDLNLSGTVRIPAGFFEDLRENDLFAICREEACEAAASDSEKNGTIGGTKIHMIHAHGDEVVDFAQAERFAGEHGIPLTVFEDEHHTLSDHQETPDKIAQIALRFFTERNS